MILTNSWGLSPIVIKILIADAPDPAIGISNPGHLDLAVALRELL